MQSMHGQGQYYGPPGGPQSFNGPQGAPHMQVEEPAPGPLSHAGWCAGGFFGGLCFLGSVAAGCFSLYNHLHRDMKGQCNGLGANPLQVNVVSYNLYWWCISDQYVKPQCRKYDHGVGFEEIYDVFKHNEPYDLIGLQECDDVNKIVRHMGYAGCLQSFHVSFDGPLVWNNQKFDMISSGEVVVGNDKYGQRKMTWVRLTIKATGNTLFFSNTHGPLFQCDGQLGAQNADNYIKAIEDHRQPTDVIIFTGDLNCGSNTVTTHRLSAKYSNDGTGNAFGGADHIFSSGLRVLFNGSTPGAPSDHNLLKVTYELPASGQGVAV